MTQHHYLLVITKHPLECIFTIVIVIKMGISIITNISDIYHIGFGMFSVISARSTFTVIHKKARTITEYTNTSKMIMSKNQIIKFNSE